MSKYLALLFGLFIAGVGGLRYVAQADDAFHFVLIGIVLVFLSQLPPGGRR